MRRLLGMKAKNATTATADYSTIRLERRVAQMVRQVAVAEKRGKALSLVVERMLRAYVEREHPELVLMYEPENDDERQLPLKYDDERQLPLKYEDGEKP